MNNKLNDFDKIYSIFTGAGYLPWIDKKEKKHDGYYSNDIHYLSINPDVVRLLEKTDMPKKPIYLKLPYDHMFISNKLSFGNIILPNGFFIDMNDEMLESDWKDLDKYNIKLFNREKPKEEEYPEGHVDYTIGFNYISDKGEGCIVFSFSDFIFPEEAGVCYIKHYNKNVDDMSNKEFEQYDEEVWEEGDLIDFINKRYKEFSIQEISEFIYKLLLFIDCPDVELRKTEGRAKHFRKKGYDFFEPKKHYTELSHDLRKYISEIKREYGVKFRYHYKYMVRGHFRTMKAVRYKNHSTIWIKPYFKGNGKYIKKEKIICRNI